MDHLPNGETGISVLATNTTTSHVCDAFVERFAMEPLGTGELTGKTFAVKDLFAVEGRVTGCGNPAWQATHAPAAGTAEPVLRLLEAGARLLGKTRTDEMAYSLDGRNTHEGAPFNPAAPERLCGGSSSGAASAVAAREVDFALGTDTAGSIRVPAAWCGLLGIRPTHGRVSMAGLVPLAPSFDTVGWLARRGQLLQRVGAVLLPYFTRDFGPTQEVLIDPQLEARRGGAALPAGLKIMGEVSLGIDLEQAADCLRVLQGAEAWASHGRWIDEVKPGFGPGVAERFTAARSITGTQVRVARRERDALVAQVNAILPAGRVVCLPPVAGPAALRGATAEDLAAQRAQTFKLTALASLTGRPQVSLPLYPAESAPVGISLLGWRGGDEALLRLAAEVLP